MVGKRGVRKSKKSEREAWSEKLQFLSDAMESTAQPFGAGGADGSTMIFNEAFCRLTGYSREELYHVNWANDLTTPESRVCELKALEVLDRTHEPQHYEKCYRRKDGSIIPIELFAHVALDSYGKVLYYYSFISDISERKKKEEKLQWITRAYQMLARCKEAMVRARDEPVLLDEICRIVVAVGGYRLAWIGYVEEDARRTVRPVARAGYDEGYVDNLMIALNDPVTGNGPTGISLKMGKPYGSRNVRSDTEMQAWRQEALKRDYLSTLNLPIMYEKQILGTLVIYSGNAGSFDDEELGLLQDLADSLAYGVKAIRDVQLRDKAERELVQARNELEARVSERTVELQKANERFDQVLNRLTDYFAIADPKWRYLYVNEAYARVTRKSPEQLLGQVVWDIIPEAIGTLNYENCIKTAEDRKPRVWTDHSPFTDRWMEYRTFAWDDGVAILSRDITERKLAEKTLQKKNEELEVQSEELETQTEELRANNEELQTQIEERKRAEDALLENQLLLRAVTDGSPDPIFVKDLQSRIMLGNPALLRVWGKPLEEVMGKNDRELYADPAIGEAIIANDRIVLESGKSQAIEEVVQTTDGLRTYLSTKTPYRNSKSEVIGILGIARDITDRKLMEISLRETRDYLESLINYANAPIIVWNPEFNITRFNHAFERLSGYEAAEVIGKNLGILFPPENIDNSLGKIRSTLGGEHWESVEIPILHKNGSVRIALWNSANIYGEKGGLLATIAQGQDITDRKHAEEELKVEKQQAELYLDLMGHDISNMHQIAMGQLELANEIMEEEGGLKGDEKELIETPLATLQKSAQLIANVRKLQSMRQGEFKEETIDLNDLLSDIVKEYEFMVPDNSIRLVGDGQHRVMANKVIHDVFSNLVGNAIKHSNGSGVDVNIRLENVSENGKNYCKVLVEDTGPGIPADMKERVFNRLQRGDTKARGLGLGLYLVKTLVESYHGKVWVEDRVQGDHTKGSRFVVLLPAVEVLNGC